MAEADVSLLFRGKAFEDWRASLTYKTTSTNTDLVIIKEWAPSFIAHIDKYVHSMHTFTSSHIRTQAQMHTLSASVLCKDSYFEKIVARSLG